MLKLHIETDNAAFAGEPWRETARILRELADKLECRAETDQSHVLRDANGNTVGQCEAHLSPSQQAECADCQWRGGVDECQPVCRYHERVEVGEPEPCGECPECGALCHEID